MCAQKNLIRRHGDLISPVPAVLFPWPLFFFYTFVCLFFLHKRCPGGGGGGVLSPCEEKKFGLSAVAAAGVTRSGPCKLDRALDLALFTGAFVSCLYTLRARARPGSGRSIMALYCFLNSKPYFTLFHGRRTAPHRTGVVMRPRHGHPVMVLRGYTAALRLALLRLMVRHTNGGRG